MEKFDSFRRHCANYCDGLIKIPERVANLGLEGARAQAASEVAIYGRPAARAGVSL